MPHFEEMRHRFGGGVESSPHSPKMRRGNQEKTKSSPHSTTENVD
ncbi:hypothetical protein [Litchfieldia alkalitelluris]|nr:hypothetical protein [Litchfieldia alkalitelluris]